MISKPLKLEYFIKTREISIVLFIVSFFIIIGLINPTFVHPKTINRIVLGGLILLFVTMGEILVIITGGIDISVGSILGLSAAIGGSLLNRGFSLPVVILVTLAVGIAAGSINGIVIGFGELPAILMTLGTMGIYRALMRIYTGGRWIQTIPRWYEDLESTTILGVSVFIWLTVAFIVLVFLFLRKARIGKYLYAVGDNQEGAILAGVPVKSAICLAYTLSGVLSAIGALIFVSQFGAVPNQTGTGLELRAIAAAVLGGVSLSGGVGSVFGAVLGALFMSAIDNSLVFLQVPGYWNNAIAGFILLLVLVADSQVRALSHSKRLY